MASTLYFQLHNCSYYGSACAALTTRAARKALSSLILRVLPSVVLHRGSFCRNCVVPSAEAEVEQQQLQQQHYLRSPELVALEYADLNLSYKLVIFIFMDLSEYS